eukprot:6473334-Amphidinium_carterae.2
MGPVPRRPEVEGEIDMSPAEPLEVRQPDPLDELLDVRVDEEMDQSVPVEASLEAEDRVYMVGAHPCIMKNGGTRMECKKCARYVTTCQGT